MPTSGSARLTTSPPDDEAEQAERRRRRRGGRSRSRWRARSGGRGPASGSPSSVASASSGRRNGRSTRPADDAPARTPRTAATRRRRRPTGRPRALVAPGHRPCVSAPRPGPARTRGGGVGEADARRECTREVDRHAEACCRAASGTIVESARSTAATPQRDNGMSVALGPTHDRGLVDGEASARAGLRPVVALGQQRLVQPQQGGPARPSSNVITTTGEPVAVARRAAPKEPRTSRPTKRSGVRPGTSEAMATTSSATQQGREAVGADAGAHGGSAPGAGDHHVLLQPPRRVVREHVRVDDHAERNAVAAERGEGSVVLPVMGEVEHHSRPCFAGGDAGARGPRCAVGDGRGCQRTSPRQIWVRT